MKGQNFLCDKLLQRFGVQKQLVLNELYGLMQKNNFCDDLYCNYFAACKIPNGLCSFDLLRFSSDTVLNIQLIAKSDFLPDNNWRYIEDIMCKNYFYLHHIKQNVICYCFCENDGLYKFTYDIKCAVRVDFDTLHNDLQVQNNSLQSEIDMHSLLNHTKFLISPLNNTYAFARGEYYLTDEQQNICDDILDKINSKQFFIYVISSLVGAGKSMLIYHIAKQLQQNLQYALIIHGGSYSDGHLRLKMQYGFDIYCIKEMLLTLQCLKINNKQYCAVLVDDSQNFTKSQIKQITNAFLLQDIPVIFVYNENQDKKENNLNFIKFNGGCDNIKIYNRYIENNLRYKNKIDFTF